MKKYIKVDIHTPTPEAAELLMAELMSYEYYAFEQQENALIAYCQEEDFDENILKQLLEPSVKYQIETIEDKNWNEQWEKDFAPVVIGNFAAVRAQFHKPQPDVKHDIVITPKMSFGTGHHATTYLMIATMEQINFENKSVLDFGCGTGVLAILAAKLGAQAVRAIDNDEWSINNMAENVQANDTLNISFDKKNSLLQEDPADILLANINLNVLKENASAIQKRVNKGGFLLVSGFLNTDEKEMEEVFMRKGFVRKSMGRRDNWSAILFSKTG